MRRLLAATICLFAVSSLAQEKKAPDADLGKKSSVAVDSSLAGDISRKKDARSAAPALQYDQFRLGVELQVASKRHEQIESLKKIIGLSPDPKEAPTLLFRLGELYWEESKYYFFEANRKDDDYLIAQDQKDKAGMERAKAEKEALAQKSKEYSRLAIEQYSEIVQRYKNYERTDEVLFFLGHNLMQQGEDRRALVAFKRLVDKYPKSKFLPDAYLAFGEYYFNNSKGKKEGLEKALEYYKKAAAYPENQVYAFALYKQGWCYYNLGNYQKAMDMYKTVVLFGELGGAAAVEKDGGKSGKNSLIREARNDYVRSYAQIGSPSDARADFGKLTSKPDDRFLMMKQLANIYYEDGKDKEAALTFNSLIRERPLSPEAPGFQGKIVDCILRAGNKKMTVEQVRRLVKIMKDVESAGTVKDDKDKKALADAQELSERTLSNLAVNWHNEGKKTRDDETFALAQEVYSDYLQLFGEGPKAYDMRFFYAELLNDNLQKYDRAAEEYTKVVQVDINRIEKEKAKPGKWLVNAAYNAVLSYDQVVKKAEDSGQLKMEPSKDNKPIPIPPLKMALLDACERYLKYVPNGDRRVDVSYKAGYIHYRHNNFDEAVKRLSDIALNHPEYKFENGVRAGETAAHLILDAYNLQGNWAMVNEWARKFYANDKLATGAFREELSRILEQSAFKLVSQLEAQKEYRQAAEAYLKFVSEFPKSEIADKALFNASVDFANARMLDRAVKTRAHLIEKYPRSEFVPAAIYANAETLEAMGEFDDAAQAYEGYVRGYERGVEGAAKAKKGKRSKKAAAPAPAPGTSPAWEESKAQVALFNAGIFREGLGQPSRAQKNREKFLELWPSSKDAEAVELSIADLYEKNGAYSRALYQLDSYAVEKGREPNKALPAMGRMLTIYETKLKRPKEVEKMRNRILKYHQELPSAKKKALEPAALEAVAHAHYLRNEDDYRYYASLKLRWGRGPSPEREFRDGLKEKARRLKVVQESYAQTVAFKVGNPAVCALYKIGSAYDNMVSTLVNAPMPRGSSPELQDAIRDELATQANPLREKAAEAFVAAVQKSRELDLYNDCARKSLKLLRETYRPDQFPPMLEEPVQLAQLKGEGVVGSPVLAQIQPIPVVTSGQREEEKENARKLRDELSGLDSKIKEVRGRDSEVASQKSTASDSSRGGKHNSGSDEPEDDL
jgi:TolA-binding protein